MVASERQALCNCPVTLPPHTCVPYHAQKVSPGHHTQRACGRTPASSEAEHIMQRAASVGPFPLLLRWLNGLPTQPVLSTRYVDRFKQQACRDGAPGARVHTRTLAAHYCDCHATACRCLALYPYPTFIQPSAQRQKFAIILP